MKKRFFVQPCDNDGSLTDSDGKPPPRDRTWDVIDRVTNQAVFINCYTRKEARDDAARRNAELANGSSSDSKGKNIGVLPE